MPYNNIKINKKQGFTFFLKIVFLEKPRGGGGGGGGGSMLTLTILNMH